MTTKTGTADETEEETTMDEAAEQPTEKSREGSAVKLTIVDRGEPRARPRRPLRLVALLLAAAIVMGAGLVTWHRAATDRSIEMAQTRDAVLIAATGDIETLNTLDSRHVTAGLKRWRAVTTGTLRDQLNQVDSDERTLLSQQKTVTTGKVVDAAVFSLDDDTATVIASVEVTVKNLSKPAAKPAVKRNRFSADLVRVRGVWLLQNLQQVAVSLS